MPPPFLIILLFIVSNIVQFVNLCYWSLPDQNIPCPVPKLNKFHFFLLLFLYFFCLIVSYFFAFVNHFSKHSFLVYLLISYLFPRFSILSYCLLFSLAQFVHLLSLNFLILFLLNFMLLCILIVSFVFSTLNFYLSLYPQAFLDIFSLHFIPF